jgi:trans-AT polyketide synthase, acyltransferase and oxidoreductase domains
MHLLKMTTSTTTTENSHKLIEHGVPWVGRATITAASLGSSEFKADYGVKYAYLAGAMYKGIASKELVVAMGQAGLLAYLGTGGLTFNDVDSAIRHIQSCLSNGQPYGMNLLFNLERPEEDIRIVELYLKHGVRNIEAAAFMQITPSLVLYRLKGIVRDQRGLIQTPTRILAKVSRPEVALVFMQPAPESIVRRLIESGSLSVAEGELGRLVPVADDICVESDSGGHTDRGVAYALTPSIVALRDELMAKYRYAKPIRVGAAGGIGTPQAAAAAFVMGAEFVLTGSINQCTVEAGTSDAVKDILQDLTINDTTYAPAGDMFELGTKVQVVKRGSFFAARANKLYEVYQRYNSIDEIDEHTKTLIQDKYFGRSFDDVWQETKVHYSMADPRRLQEVANNPKRKMALLFKWYFVHSARLALQGCVGQEINYQIHCGPALGAFNQWVKPSTLRNWRNRSVAHIAELIMNATAESLTVTFNNLNMMEPGVIGQEAARNVPGRSSSDVYPCSKAEWQVPSRVR